MEVSRNQRRKMTDEKNTETVTPMVVGLDRKVSRLEPDARKATCKSPPHRRDQLEDLIKLRLKNATAAPVWKSEIKWAGYCCDDEFIRAQLAKERGVRICEHEFSVWRSGKQLDDYMAANDTGERQTTAQETR